MVTTTGKSKEQYRLRLAFARASRFFVRFVVVTARLRPENFREDVNKLLRNFLSLSEIGYGFEEFNSRRVRLHLTK